MPRSDVPDLVVLTVDQRGSRTGPDLVDELLRSLDAAALSGHLLLRFERTAGDEVQGVLSNAQVAVRLALDLAETGAWSTGVGVGPVRQPLPSSTRAAGGPAFEYAREAVERAKGTPEGVAVGGPDGEGAQHAEAVLRLLAAVALRRSEPGLEVVRLLRTGLTGTEVAARLGITKQAVSQRARAAMWAHEEQTVAAVGSLLRLAAGGREPVPGHAAP